MNNKNSWLDKAKQNKKYCGPKCTGPFDKAFNQKSNENKSPCRCETDANKCSCIKPWLDKAAEKVRERRASSTGSASPARPLPLTPSMFPCPPCAPTSPLPIQTPPQVCTTPECKQDVGEGKKVCSDKPECKRKNKRGSCATTCRLGKKPCPKKSKKQDRPVCGSPLPSPDSGLPCNVCQPMPTPEPPKPPEPKPVEPKPVEPKPAVQIKPPPAEKPSQIKPPPSAKPSQVKPPPPPKPSQTKPPAVAKPSGPKLPPKPVVEAKPSVPQVPDHDEHDVFENKIDYKPKPVQKKPCSPCPKGTPCPPCPPCPPCAPTKFKESDKICKGPCESEDPNKKKPCKKKPPCPGGYPPSDKPCQEEYICPVEPPVCPIKPTRPVEPCPVELPVCPIKPTRPVDPCPIEEPRPCGDRLGVYFIGVDVGTGSVRAALVKDNGTIVKTHVHDIKTWNIQTDYYEQSSDDIWNAVCVCVKNVTSQISPEMVRGIGFDATCSLVCVDQNGQPLSVSPTGKDEQNIILWLDHRAIKEADEINEKKHGVLKFVGGKISPEQETPKLMWLKRNLRTKCWDRAGYFFDLPDFLTWRATDADSRSICSLVCKWNFEMKLDGSRVEGTNGWNTCFFQQLDLLDLSNCNWKKIGSQILVPGCPVGEGLSNRAAKEFCLNAGTPIGTSIIDAHAGGLGLIGCKACGADQDFHTRISLICGTSTCHMAVSGDPILTPGIWGPYRHAMIPGMWLNEGGQSATGKLIDHIIDSHPATPDIKKNIGSRHIQDYLNELLNKMSARCEDIAVLTTDLHVWPDFHGNRSPIADPTLKGMISGLTLNQDAESLALLYLATLQALAYGARHIIERLRCCGYDDLKTMLICGGLSKNKVFAKTLADACNMSVIVPDEPESVLLGAAMLGARASGYYPDMTTTIQCMAGKGEIMYPDSQVVRYHDRKYKVFLKMYQDQMSYRRMMRCVCNECIPEDKCVC